MASTATLSRIKKAFSTEKYLSEKEIVAKAGISRPTFLNVVNKTQYLTKRDAHSCGINTGVQYVYEWTGIEIDSSPRNAPNTRPVDVKGFLNQVNNNPDAILSKVYNMVDTREKVPSIVGGLETLIAAINQKFPPF